MQLDLFQSNATQQVIHGDCLEVMKTFPDNHFTHIVTDPPYGLRFMGKRWDYEIPGQDVWAEILRVCSPGAMMLCFGGSRTYHRLAVEIENAGWEIRDCLMWIYGSGFPKSHNFGKAVGGEWLGYGTALKPAYEPILLAMKPIEGTFVLNAEKWGVAGINVDATRIETSDVLSFGSRELGDGIKYGKCNPTTEGVQNSLGRWPANVIFDQESGKLLDEMSGVLKSGGGDLGHKTQDGGYGKKYGYVKDVREPNSGGASRFFYCPKASSSERNQGCETLKSQTREGSSGNNRTRICGFCGLTDNGSNDHSKCDGNIIDKISKPNKNFHPTVKPIRLLEYLLKLITPPGGGLVLDPFLGSGSTLLAASNLGFDGVGIEKEESYVAIANARISQ